MTIACYLIDGDMDPLSSDSRAGNKSTYSLKYPTVGRKGSACFCLSRVSGGGLEGKNRQGREGGVDEVKWEHSRLWGAA